MIPFVRQLDAVVGRPERLSPRILGLLADNAGPFTYTGTRVFIIGNRQDVAVIDPGPLSDTHFAALKSALEGRRVACILVTHSHSDHSPLARPLADWAGCQIWAGGKCIASEGAVRLEAGDDLTFCPDHILTDGQVFSGDGWTIEAIATPGHTVSHFCFALAEENAVFSGDHVMGWSTTVISPPDGHMGQYMASLEKIRSRHFDRIWPTHGPHIDDVDRFLGACIAHRRQRETQIIERLHAGDRRIPQIVRSVYASVERSLHPAACHSVLAHMIHLHETGRVEVEGSVTVAGRYRPARSGGETMVGSGGETMVGSGGET